MNNTEQKIQAVVNHCQKYKGRIQKKTAAESENTRQFGKTYAKQVRAFHQSFPSYKPTELKSLKNLSEYLGVKSLHIKDESTRFGLNAFKGLGGSYCIGRYLGEICQIPLQDLDYQILQSDPVKEILKDITFVTATDGNHGRGVAWTARELGVNAVVYMPHGSAKERLENIRSLGAKAEITEWNYDDTVRFAARCEKEKGWVLVQDTAWEGYEKIPTWIMQGYTTMALEAVEQLEGKIPTHIFLQAGVGAMSGALAAFFTDYYGEKKPVIVIVEPDHADCIFRTAQAADGKLHTVTGNLNTIMAGLACGEPCTVGWDMLETYADYFISMPDYVAANGMRILGNPLAGDAHVISGESGAATTGFVTEVLRNKELENIKEMLHLDEESRILCFSTEGDTDRENYRKIVWDGMYVNENSR